jgi:hypothetical protein
MTAERRIGSDIRSTENTLFHFLFLLFLSILPIKQTLQMESMSDELHTQPFYHIETISYLAQRKALRLIINTTMNTSDTEDQRSAHTDFP